MQIFIWESADAPPHARFMARVLLRGKFTTMVSHGPDREKLRQHVQDFLEAERNRLVKRNKKMPAPKKSENEQVANTVTPPHQLEGEQCINIDLDDLLS